MPRETVNLFHVDNRAVADSLLASLREQGLEGSISEGDDASGGAIVLFWRPGQWQSGRVVGATRA